jgi:hypothetical protein
VDTGLDRRGVGQARRGTGRSGHRVGGLRRLRLGKRAPPARRCV